TGRDADGAGGGPERRTARAGQARRAVPLLRQGLLRGDRARGSRGVDLLEVRGQWPARVAAVGDDPPPVPGGLPKPSHCPFPLAVLVPDRGARRPAHPLQPLAPANGGGGEASALPALGSRAPSRPSRPGPRRARALTLTAILVEIPPPS